MGGDRSEGVSAFLSWEKHLPDRKVKCELKIERASPGPLGAEAAK